MVNDPGFLKWLLALVMFMGTLLFGWTHSRANNAHARIDNERKDNEDRFILCYGKIAEQAASTQACKLQLEEDIKHHMTEEQIKDFVDRTVKPIETQIKAVHDDVKLLLAKGN